MLSIFALVISLNVAVRIYTSWNYIFQDWLILFFPPYLLVVLLPQVGMGEMSLMSWNNVEEKMK